MNKTLRQRMDESKMDFDIIKNNEIIDKNIILSKFGETVGTEINKFDETMEEDFNV